MYIKRIIILILGIGLIFMGSFAFYVYKVMFMSNTSFENDYVHFEGLKSYKNNYYKMFCDLGNYSLINKFSFSEKSFCFSKKEDDRILSLIHISEPTRPY